MSAKAQHVASTPWDFRMRGLVVFVGFGLAFFLGYLVQAALVGDVTPTYVLIGRRWGDAGVVAMAWVAAGFTLSAWLVRLWASSYHAAGVVMSSDVVTGTFTAAGPYRFVRNPLYFGNVLLSIGMGFVGPPAVTAFVVGFNIAFVYRLIGIEERFLQASEGEAYRAYLAAVPRLFPRIGGSRIAGAERKPNVGRGFVTELFMLGFAAAMAYYAFHVSHHENISFVGPFWTIAASAVILQIILERALRGQK